MNRRTFQAASLVSIAFALAGAGCGGGGSGSGPGSNSPSSPLVGQAAPEVSSDYVTGDGPKTVKEAAGKVAIVEFWGTFCDPCKESFPKYQEMVDQLGGQLVIIAISRDDADDKKPADLKDFAKTAKAKFTILWDKKGDDAKKYDPQKMPTAYILDKKGVVRFVHAGYNPGEEAQIAEHVKTLAAE